CDPEKAIQLRERYDAVQPGFHMSKNLWNTVNYDGIPDDKLIFEWIDHSYDQVVKGLPKKIRNQLNELNQ
ncbi:MAG TPA: MmcQ/YjbR family DNA-binding protein, partial [Bacteroidales bacterium]|nr:MmcQ/YjbR family DNA-binding protein [Bacteroidales bacterium]